MWQPEWVCTLGSWQEGKAAWNVVCRVLGAGEVSVAGRLSTGRTEHEMLNHAQASEAQAALLFSGKEGTLKGWLIKYC